VPVLNGIPWWFLNSLRGFQSAAPLDAVDPLGLLLRSIPLFRVVGCVVHAAASLEEIGFSRINAKHQFILGEINGERSDRIDLLSQVFADAGLPVAISERIHTEVWKKLLANMVFNPLSALTRSSTDRLVNNGLLLSLITNVSREATTVAQRLGLSIEESLEMRLASTRRLGSFKTSMLQDFEAGRPLELDALLTAPREIAKRLNIDTPAIDSLLGLTKLLDESRGHKSEISSQPHLQFG
jgi:2-dehydropantoate 2-reductase